MSPRPHDSGIRLDGADVVVVASGYADGPSQPLVRFLVEHGARRVTDVVHPLVGEGANEHVVTTWSGGEVVDRRVRRRPHRPPFTYAFDPLTPALLPRADLWVGFHCLATGQGLVRRAARRVSHVIHWNVDFVPQRFGPGLLTRGYERLDRWCCTAADGRVELSQAALDARLAAYGLGADDAPAEVIPMGTWLAESPATSADHLVAPRLVFLGHLVERMGVPLVLDLADELRRRGRSVGVDVVGGGPLLEQLRGDAARRHLDQVITFHGFVQDFADVQAILAGAVVALAPYEVDDSSFSRFADPGKLKAYLGAGLPVLLTPVPPNVDDLTANAGARSLPPDASAFADAVVDLLDHPDEWARRSQAARTHAGEFDWGRLFGRSLPRLGVHLH